MKNLPKWAINTITLTVVAALIGVGVYFFFFDKGPMKTVKARFAAAVGIYVGTPVDILGVPVGQVTAVQPEADYVVVTLQYDGNYQVPADAGAVEVANSLVSDRYIQLAPVYKGHGPVMQSGAVIPLNHTGAPAELDDIYSALNKLSVALGPKGVNKGGKHGGALNTLLTVAAANLKGNGAAIGNSISKLSQAAQTLADNRGNLFQTVKNLQKFASTLKGSDAQIRLFNKQLAEVAGDLADERGDLGAALHELGITLDTVASFVKTNAGKFHTDIKGLESITGTLVKEKAAINETLAVAPVALANIVHAYDPQPGVLATRSNLASLANFKLTDVSLKQVCSTLTSVVGGVKALAGLGGNLSKVCKALPDTATGSGSSSSGSSTPSLPSLPGLVGGGS